RWIVLGHRLHLVYRHHDRAQIALGRGVLEGGSALLALEEQLYAAETALNLTDARDDTHRVEDVRRRFVGIVALRDGEDEPLAFEGRFDSPKRSRPTRGDRRSQPRKNDGSPEWKNRKCLACCHF